MNADHNTPNGTRVEGISPEYRLEGLLTVVGPDPDDPGNYAVVVDKYFDLHYMEWRGLKIVEEEGEGDE